MDRVLYIEDLIYSRSFCLLKGNRIDDLSKVGEIDLCMKGVELGSGKGGKGLKRND